uniref:Uncharacterized protein n=1 Tax=Romanomermis culicivorax TaxID=13658 RepID=A0A915KZI3_ROMCU
MKTIDQKMSKNRQKLWSSSGEKILEKILTNEDENKRLVGELRLNFRAQRRKGVKLRVNVVERRKCINKIRNNRRSIRQRLSNIKDTVRSKSPEKFSTPTTTPIVRLDKNLIDCLEKARQDLELVELEIEPWLHICKEADEDFVNKNQESILLHEINKHVGQSRRDLVDDSAIFLANLPEELKRSVSRRDAIPKAVADAISVAVEFFDDCSKLCQDCKSLESLAIDFDHNLKQLLDGNERLSQFLDSMKNCDSNKYYYAIENAVADNHCHSTPAVPFLRDQESLISFLAKLYDWCRLELSKPSRFVEQISTTSSRGSSEQVIRRIPSSSATSTPSSPTVDWSIEKAWLVDMRLPVNDQLATIEKQLERATVENKQLLEKVTKIENDAKERWNFEKRLTIKLVLLA